MRGMYLTAGAPGENSDQPVCPRSDQICGCLSVKATVYSDQIVRMLTWIRVFFLLTVSRRFLCCKYSFSVRLWFHLWRLLCLYLFLIYHSFGALGACAS